MLRHAQLFHHVKLPDQVRLILVLIGFGGKWPIVFAIVKPFGVHTHHRAPTRYVPNSFSVHVRRIADTLERPVVDSSGWQFRVGMLPQELSGCRIETQHAAQVDIGWVTFDVATTVVCPHINAAIGSHRVSVCLRSQFRLPLDVLSRLDIPRDGNIHSLRRVVSATGTTPLRPVEFSNVESGYLGQRHGGGIVLTGRLVLGLGQRCDKKCSQAQHGQRVQNSIHRLSPLWEGALCCGRIPWEGRGDYLSFVTVRLS